MTLTLKSRGKATGDAFASRAHACPNEEENMWKYTTGTEWIAANLQAICNEGMNRMMSVNLFVTYDLSYKYLKFKLG